MIRKRLLTNCFATFVSTFILFLSSNTPRAEYCRCSTTVNGICIPDRDDDSCILTGPIGAIVGGVVGAIVGGTVEGIEKGIEKSGDWELLRRIK
jgi:hypothetical protein